MEFAGCVLLALIWALSTEWVYSNCLLNIRQDFDKKAPLVLIPGGSHNIEGFYYVHGNGDLNVHGTRKILLACPKGPNNIKNTGQMTSLATCGKGKYFELGGIPTSFEKISCSRDIPQSSARETTKQCGTSTSKIVEAGFEVGSDFYTMYEVCFDSADLHPVYSKHRILASIAAHQITPVRPAFTKGTAVWRTINPTSLYPGTKQIDTFTEILGSKTEAEKYFKAGLKLQKGHLVPNVAFLFVPQQRATFYYENTAPQWSCLNMCNWKKLEDSVRNYATNNRVDLDVYTGTYGISTLPDKNGIQQKLYLYADANNGREMPVPMLFWKIVVNKVADAGVVCLSVNNPHITPGPEYYICNRVTNQITWVSWTPDDIAKGISYCCDVNSFLTNVNGLPSIHVTNLLT